MQCSIRLSYTPVYYSNTKLAGGIGFEPTSASLTVRCLTVRRTANKIGSPTGILTPISPFVAVCRVRWTTGPNRALPLSYASQSEARDLGPSCTFHDTETVGFEPTSRTYGLRPATRRPAPEGTEW